MFKLYTHSQFSLYPVLATAVAIIIFFLSFFCLCNTLVCCFWCARKKDERISEPIEDFVESPKEDRDSEDIEDINDIHIEIGQDNRTELEMVP